MIAGISCAECAYLMLPKAYGRDPTDFRLGQCRRLPPVQHVTENGLRSMFPLVPRDWWCGEHAVAPGLDEDEQ